MVFTVGKFFTTYAMFGANKKTCIIFILLSCRNLFKKVSLLVKTHQIPLDAFLVALKMMKVEDIDKDETECILVRKLGSIFTSWAGAAKKA